MAICQKTLLNKTRFCFHLLLVKLCKSLRLQNLIVPKLKKPTFIFQISWLFIPFSWANHTFSWYCMWPAGSLRLEIKFANGLSSSENTLQIFKNNTSVLACIIIKIYNVEQHIYQTHHQNSQQGLKALSWRYFQSTHQCSQKRTILHLNNNTFFRYRQAINYFTCTQWVG